LDYPKKLKLENKLTRGIFFMEHCDNILYVKKKGINNLQSLVSVLNRIRKELYSFTSSDVTIEEIESLCNINDNTRYNGFLIPKKQKGKFRIINAPNDRLKEILTAINYLLSANYHPKLYITGFVKGCSVVTNAAIHTKQNFVYNIDLYDFFGSINYNQVVKSLKEAPYFYSDRIASTIAGLTCIKVNNSVCLAQGAPASPILSNLVCKKMDHELYDLSLQYNIKYSRYADDITFSGNSNIFTFQGDFYKKLEQIINKNGFRINLDKVRILSNKVRQEVTGLIVNERVNVSQSYIKDIRNLLYIWDRYGYKQAYLRFFVKHKPKYLAKHKIIPYFIHYLKGKLNYLSLVRGKEDRSYLKFRHQFDQLLLRKNNSFNAGYYKSIKKFERENGPILFDLENCNAKFGEFEEIITFSPKLKHLINIHDGDKLQFIYDNCAIHNIFDKEGVKWLMAIKYSTLKEKAHDSYPAFRH